MHLQLLKQNLKIILRTIYPEKAEHSLQYPAVRQTAHKQRGPLDFPDAYNQGESVEKSYARK